MLERVRDERDLDAVVVERGDGERDAVDRDRALLDAVAAGARRASSSRRRAPSPSGSSADDPTAAVDVALDEVPAERLARAQRRLEVDLGAGRETAERRARDRLRDGVELERDSPSAPRDASGSSRRPQTESPAGRSAPSPRPRCAGERRRRSRSAATTRPRSRTIPVNTHEAPVRTPRHAPGTKRHRHARRCPDTLASGRRPGEPYSGAAEGSAQGSWTYAVSSRSSPTGSTVRRLSAAAPASAADRRGARAGERRRDEDEQLVDEVGGEERRRPASARPRAGATARPRRRARRSSSSSGPERSSSSEPVGQRAAAEREPSRLRRGADVAGRQRRVVGPNRAHPDRDGVRRRRAARARGDGSPRRRPSASRAPSRARRASARPCR